MKSGKDKKVENWKIIHRGTFDLGVFNLNILHQHYLKRLITIRYRLTVLKNNCKNQDYPDWVNLRTWFLFLYQKVQHDKTENIKAESGQMTEWKALEPENDSIWRTAIAPWFSSLESSIQHRLKSSSRVKWRSKVISCELPLMTY